jgi:hypothetical protein
MDEAVAMPAIMVNMNVAQIMVVLLLKPYMALSSLVAQQPITPAAGGSSPRRA